MTDDVSVTTPLADLIARLEKATGPDRRLDFSIAQAVENAGPMEWRANGFPYYTSSLDAALTLVPDCTPWAAGEDEDGTGCADIPRHRVLVHAATPALALCIAALKARSAT